MPIALVTKRDFSRGDGMDPATGIGRPLVTYRPGDAILEADYMRWPPGTLQRRIENGFVIYDNTDPAAVARAEAL